jgi:hypothetical protein
VLISCIVPAGPSGLSVVVVSTVILTIVTSLVVATIIVTAIIVTAIIVTAIVTAIVTIRGPVASTLVSTSAIPLPLLSYFAGSVVHGLPLGIPFFELGDK